MQNPEKFEKSALENYLETVKSADMAELLRLKQELYRQADVIQSHELVCDWHDQVKQLEPDCQKSRLHHFLIGSSTSPGTCQIDDLPGDLSAEAFLRADQAKRRQMIDHLKSQVGKTHENS